LIILVRGVLHWADHAEEPAGSEEARRKEERRKSRECVHIEERSC
jgi:hypothetical protein